MSKCAKFITKTKPRAKLVFRTKRRIGVDGLAEALGASSVTRIDERPDTPLGFVVLRQKVFSDV
jgi:hypothetical protein